MIIRTPLQAIDDILTAISEIDTFLKNYDQTRFAKDKLARRAVERCLEVISEAARHIPPSLTDLRPDIPWADIRGIGNAIRHDYAEVSVPVIWNVTRDHLKPLKKACDKIRDVATALPSSATPITRRRRTRAR